MLGEHSFRVSELPPLSSRTWVCMLALETRCSATQNTSAVSAVGQASGLVNPNLGNGGMNLGRQLVWIQILSLPATSCVALGNFPSLRPSFCPSV